MEKSVEINHPPAICWQWRNLKRHVIIFIFIIIILIRYTSWNQWKILTFWNDTRIIRMYDNNNNFKVPNFIIKSIKTLFPENFDFIIYFIEFLVERIWMYFLNLPRMAKTIKLIIESKIRKMAEAAFKTSVSEMSVQSVHEILAENIRLKCNGSSSSQKQSLLSVRCSKWNVRPRSPTSATLTQYSCMRTNTI